MSDLESQTLRTDKVADNLDVQIAAMELASQEAEEKARKEQKECGKRLAAMKVAVEEKRRKAEEERKQIEEERWKAEEEAWKKAEKEAQERAEKEARKKTEEIAADKAQRKAAAVKGKGKARPQNPLSSPDQQPAWKCLCQQVYVELRKHIGELGLSWKAMDRVVIDVDEERRPGRDNPCWRCRKKNLECEENEVEGKFPCHRCEDKHLGCGEEPAPKWKRRGVDRSDTGSVWSEESIGGIGALVEVVQGIQTDLGQILGTLQQISRGMRAMQNDIKTNGTLLEALAWKSGVPEDEILRAYDGEWDKKEKRSERPEERPESSDAPGSKDEEDEDEVENEVGRGGMEVDG